MLYKKNTNLILLLISIFLVVSLACERLNSKDEGIEEPTTQEEQNAQIQKTTNKNETITNNSPQNNNPTSQNQNKPINITPPVIEEPALIEQDLTIEKPFSIPFNYEIWNCTDSDCYLSIDFINSNDYPLSFDFEAKIITRRKPQVETYPIKIKNINVSSYTVKAVKVAFVNKYRNEIYINEEDAVFTFHNS